MKIRHLCLLPLAMALLCFGCRKTGISPTNCRDGKCTYTVKVDQQLEFVGDSIPDFVRRISGDKLVFAYEYNKKDKENIADDEYTEYIYFEIDPEADSFEFSDSTLASCNLVMQPICYCLSGYGIPVSGTLSGTKLSEERWQVELDVVFDWNDILREREISAEFEVD